MVFLVKVKNEIKVGLLALVSLIILIVGYDFLKNQSLFKTKNTFFAVYPKVEGLLPSNPVLINGYKVGMVKKIGLNQKTMKICVEIDVDEEIKVFKDATIKIANNDLVGSKAIELSVGNDSLGLANNRDTLKGEQDAGIAQAISSVLTPLSVEVKNVLEGVDSTLAEGMLNRTLAEMIITLKSIRKAADISSEIIVGKNESINQILAKVNKVSDDLTRLTPHLSRLAESATATTQKINDLEIKKTLESINRSSALLNTQIARLNDSNGTYAKLVDNPSLYQNLNQTLADLNQLIVDVQDYPSIYTGITKGQRKRARKKKADGIKENP